MALKITEIKPNVFEIIESIHGFNDTKRTSWYYDLDRNLISEKEDFPKSDWGITRDMSQADIDWFENYHRPNAILLNKSIDTA